MRGGLSLPKLPSVRHLRFLRPFGVARPPPPRLGWVEGVAWVLGLSAGRAWAGVMRPLRAMQGTSQVVANHTGMPTSIVQTSAVSTDRRVAELDETSTAPTAARPVTPPGRHPWSHTVRTPPTATMRYAACQCDVLPTTRPRRLWACCHHL